MYTIGYVTIYIWFDRSETEEEYSELIQLLEDISTYQRDVQSAMLREREGKRQKQLDDKKIAEEMRRSAMETISRKCMNFQYSIFTKLLNAERKRRREREREKENDSMVIEDDECDEEDEFDHTETQSEEEGL